MSTIELNPTESSDFVLTETCEKKLNPKIYLKRLQRRVYVKHQKFIISQPNFLCVHPLGFSGRINFMLVNP